LREIAQRHTKMMTIGCNALNIEYQTSPVSVKRKKFGMMEMNQMMK
jgi:hypothetical protein